MPAALCGEVSGFAPDRCIVDLVDRKLLVFGGEDDNWAAVTRDLPEALQDGAEELRTQLIDTACSFDDDAMEKYFNDGDLSPADLRKTIRTATLSGSIVPVFAGTSLRCVGVQPVLDGIVDYLPSPLDREAVTGFSLTKSGERQPETRSPSPDDPFWCSSLSDQGLAANDSVLHASIGASEERLPDAQSADEQEGNGHSDLAHPVDSRERVDRMKQGWRHRRHY